MVSDLSDKDATFRILDLVRELYSDDPIIEEFFILLRQKRSQVFRYLED